MHVVAKSALFLYLIRSELDGISKLTYSDVSGANYNSMYLPDITSYDYDAPLSEAGDPTPKYLAIRDAIAILIK